MAFVNRHAVLQVVLLALILATPALSGECDVDGNGNCRGVGQLALGGAAQLTKLAKFLQTFFGRFTKGFSPEGAHLRLWPAWDSQAHLRSTRQWQLQAGMDGTGGKLFCAPSDRNKDAILEVLQKYLTTCEPGAVVEVASGTGQHVSFFAPFFPHLMWQPTDLDKSKFRSIRAYIAEIDNVLRPTHLDSSEDFWGRNIEEELLDASGGIRAIFAANITHVSPITATKGLFAGAGRLLGEGGLLLIYGPFTISQGEFTSDGNLEFHRSLIKQDKEWGYRDVTDLEEMADMNGLALVERVQMPANNFLLVFEKPVFKDTIYK